MSMFEDFIDQFNFMQKKTIKDIADKYPDPPKEKVIETTCPCCVKKLRLRIKA